jgi:hypothetical protein
VGLQDSWDFRRLRVESDRPDSEAANGKSRPFWNIIPLLLQRAWENNTQILDPRCPQWRQPLHALLLRTTSRWVILDGFKTCKHLLHDILCSYEMLHWFLCYMELNPEYACEMRTNLNFAKEGRLRPEESVFRSSTKHTSLVVMAHSPGWYLSSVEVSGELVPLQIAIKKSRNIQEHKKHHWNTRNTCSKSWK